MNVNELAAQVETDYKVKLGRDSKGEFVTQPFMDDGILETMNRTRLSFIGELEYGGGVRSFFKIPFSATKSTLDDCALMEEGLATLIGVTQKALNARDEAVPALSTKTCEVIAVAIDRRIAPAPRTDLM